MDIASHHPPSSPTRSIWKKLVEGQRSLCARVVVSWTLAGGLTAGGFLLALTTWGHPETAGMVLPATPILFTMGAAAGLFHGALLAYLGRPPALDPSSARRSMFGALASLVITLPVAAILAGWIALFSATPNVGPGARAAAAAAAVAGLLVLTWAALEGWKALSNAFARWPHARLGTLILSTVLAILVVLFHQVRPEIWFTDVRVTGWGAIGLAFVATLWIAAPVVIFLLGFLPTRARERTSEGEREARR